jgi:hypothetical protein
MQFSIGRPDIIRAINQRWLLKFWNRHLGAHQVPLWQALEADDLTRISASLSFLDVSGSGAQARFQVRFYGEDIAKAYGLPDFRGKCLDEIVPSPRHNVALAPYHETLERRCPVYTIHDIHDRCGRLVHFERLLLPFSRNGERVDRILASFEFISPDGAFESDSLMTTQKGAGVLQVSAFIEPRTLA